MAQRAGSRTRTVLLSVSLVAAIAVAAHGILRDWLWQEEVYPLIGIFGSARADEDFRNGKLRLFELGSEQERDTFTGRSEGPFEIWNPQYFPTRGYPHRYVTEEMVVFYNLRMQYMHAHPEKFSTSIEGPVVDHHP
ncbi:MAG: hypothetical protein JNL58_28710 [Planctomyces sp.]|nr:hypothetical protein [Planctomyces sp.]